MSGELVLREGRLEEGLRQRLRDVLLSQRRQPRRGSHSAAAGAAVRDVMFVAVASLPPLLQYGHQVLASPLCFVMFVWAGPPDKDKVHKIGHRQDAGSVRPDLGPLVEVQEQAHTEAVGDGVTEDAGNVQRDRAHRGHDQRRDGTKGDQGGDEDCGDGQLGLVRGCSARADDDLRSAGAKRQQRRTSQGGGQPELGAEPLQHGAEVLIAENAYAHKLVHDERRQAGALQQLVGGQHGD
mmetsp:Transcript_19562/g.58937  ORF Transcript_19562/g.58937 Transcript_19562/m.58937 type:complete len:238 (-) Transcript_19562:32-745(-)